MQLSLSFTKVLRHNTYNILLFNKCIYRRGLVFYFMGFNISSLRKALTRCKKLSPKVNNAEILMLNHSQLESALHID